MLLKDKYEHLAVPMVGDVLLGQVISVGDRISTLIVSTILRYNGKSIKILGVPRTTHSYIFKGDVKFPFTKLSEIIKIGDLILGRVKIDWFRPVFISLDSPELGVVSAICERCGTVMPTPKMPEQVICPRCRNVRRTKISTLYEPITWRSLHIKNKIHIYPPAQ